MDPACDRLLDDALLLDIEAERLGTDRSDPPRLLEIGAVRRLEGETEELRLKRPGGDDLDRLDDFAAPCRRILGHYVVRHDLPILRRHRPDLRLLTLPVVDTLFLSPLAFPEIPYHSLVKDYRLAPEAVNDPVADAELAARLFGDEWTALARQETATPGLLSFYAACLVSTVPGTADALLQMLGQPAGGEPMLDKPVTPPDAPEFFAAQASKVEVCARNLQIFLEDVTDPLPEMAYALAWLRVSDTNSVLPPWVRAEFPRLPQLLDRLRRPDRLCMASSERRDCGLCATGLSARDELYRNFQFKSFRAEPRADDGSSLQERVTTAGLERRSHLAILATGAGKSICYQLPALVHHRRRGELTIVISPLQALMRDQVEGLRRRTGGERAAALYGLLTPLERGKVLERIRWGEIGLLYVAPEQLRNRSFFHTVAQREIAAWVYDEAHCLSKWGHDFRPDYLYAARFIRDLAERQARPVPPVSCFTATAKRDVIAEITEHVRTTLGHELEVFRSDVERDELRFRVERMPPQRKLARVHELLSERAGAGASQGGSGTSVVYFSSRRGTEDAARYLQERGILAERFHAGLPMAEKRRVLDDFTAGRVPAVCATNAFGMGIDRDDVRLVVHAEVPGSLESYLQEAGRAGRDRETADCVLLFDDADVERQFRLAAYSRLDGRELAEILRAVRRAVRRARRDRSSRNEAVVTSGDLLRDEQIDLELAPGDPIAGTKVRTAVAWLERTGFVERAENRTRVFQGKLRVRSLAEVEERLKQLDQGDDERRRWRAVLRALVAADPENGLSADELAQLPEAGFEGDDAGLQVLRTLAEMASKGLLEEGLQLVVHLDPSRARGALDRLARLERELIAVLREESPDAEGSGGAAAWQALSIRRVNQHLLDRLAAADDASPTNPELLRRVLDGLASLPNAAADVDGPAVRRARAVELRASSREFYRLRLGTSWAALSESLLRRAEECSVVLHGLIQSAGGTSQRGRQGVAVGLEDLVDALRADLAVGPDRARPEVAEQALLHLHEQGVVQLQNGLAVFRQAMTLRLRPEAHGRRLTRRHVEPLREHYRERDFQVHVMARYAELAAERLEAGLELVRDYFERKKDAFVARHFPGDGETLERPTGAASFRRIAELGNPEQERIVTAPEDANLLVLAGPGSGKTRVVVHRCAWLLRVARVPSRSVVVLCFNRNAALELRRRLYRLVQDDARGVTVTTFHSLALRLTGHSFATAAARETLKLDEVIREAVDQLSRPANGGSNAALNGDVGDVEEVEEVEEVDELRERLFAGFRHILVDEYQDITDDQYELVRLLAGRHPHAGQDAGPDVGRNDDRPEPSILAVGDDDQTIYGWAGAEIAFLRRFREEYEAERHVLSRCYRATRAILDVTNDFASRIPGRMKSEPLVVDPARRDLPRGESVRLVRLATPEDQARAVVARIEALQQTETENDDFEPHHVAVLARTHAALQPVRAALEAAGVPVSWAGSRDALPPLHRVREVAVFLDRLAQNPAADLTYRDLLRLETELNGPQPTMNPWRVALRDALSEWRAEAGEEAAGAAAVATHLYDSLAEQRRAPAFGDGVTLSTVHAAKGLEFRHVIVVNGGWADSLGRGRSGGQSLEEEEQRLFYVAMTRARQTLQVFTCDGSGNPHAAALESIEGVESRRPANLSADLPPIPTEALSRRYHVLGLSDVYLSWAAAEGTFADESLRQRSVRAAAGLASGDPVRLAARGSALRILAGKVAVAQLSAQGQETWAPRLSQIQEARVLAMVRRTAADGDPDPRHPPAIDRWEVPVVEVVTG